MYPRLNMYLSTYWAMRSYLLRRLGVSVECRAGQRCCLPKSTASAIVFMFLASLSWAIADTHYVNVSNPVPSTPFSSWETAATNIQDAIDVASPGNTILVAKGTYDTNGVIVHRIMTTHIAITNEITVSSISGPANTLIVGHGHLGESAVRCAYVGTNAVLDGFTLTNGHTRSSGDFFTERNGGGVRRLAV